MKQLQSTGNGELQKLKKLSTERQIKAVLRGNPHSHRQERCWSRMPLDNHIIHMDKVAIRIEANNHQPDRRRRPVRTTDQDRKIPMLWTWIGHRSADLLLNVTDVKKWAT